MTLDIKSVDIKPKRETFGHIERRIGEGKSASRYEEATYDLQPVANFHYKPTYNSKYELYDSNKTAIEMDDWYKLLDPRQFYYSSYVMTRAKQQEVAEQNFVFVEKRNLLNVMPENIKEQILKWVLPLRHYEWGANMNNLQLVSESYGASIASACMFHAEDRLGNAQYLTRIGLMLCENNTTILDNSKEDWLKVEQWQPLRKAMEDSFVIEDWFELFVVQNFIMDGFIHPLVFNVYEQELNAKGGSAQSMMSEFITTWYEESSRWVDKSIEVAAKNNSNNHKTIKAWVQKYLPIVQSAIMPLAQELLDNPEENVEVIKQNLIERLKQNSIEL